MSSNDREPTAQPSFKKSGAATEVWVGGELIGYVASYNSASDKTRWYASLFDEQPVKGSFASRKLASTALILAHQGLVREEGR